MAAGGQHLDPRPASAHNSMSGTAETVVQAGQIHGDVHVHAAVPRQRTVPRQLLPPPRHFASRRRELAALDDALGDTGRSAPVVLLRGPGGVGKTALALHWFAGRAERFPDGQLYAKLTEAGGEPTAPDDVLGQFLRALGVRPRQVPVGLAERMTLYRSLTADRSLGVLLDDAVSAAQVRVLLVGSATSAVLVTSRRPLVGLLAAGTHVVEVEPLSHDSAMELLESRLGVDRVAAERGPAQTMASLCGGWPIALVVVAALAVARPRRSLARTASDLSDERRRLQMLSTDEEISVRSTFDVSYSDLSECARRAYRALGLCPGVTFGVELIAAAADLSAEEAEHAVDELVDASLLTDTGDDQFRLHDLIRLHARHCADAIEPPELRSATLRRAAEWYLLVARAADRAVMPSRRMLSFDFPPTTAVIPAGIDGYDAALGWLERERHNLAAMVRAVAEMGWPELTHQLVDALQPLFIVHKHDRAAVEVGEVALRIAVEAGDVAAENNLRKRLGRTYARLGEPERAERHVADMLLANRERGDREGEASALKARGVLFAQAGRHAEAEEAFRRTTAILAELDRPRPQGLVLIELGATLSELGRFGEAAELLERARAILSCLAEPDDYNATRAAITLAHNQVRVGELSAAAVLLADAVATMARLGSDFERARANRVLAELHRHAGNTEAAHRHEDIADALLGTVRPG